MWKDLNMQQRADLMDMFLEHGITSLDEMRNFYDNRPSDNYSQDNNLYPNGGLIGKLQRAAATANEWATVGEKVREDKYRKALEEAEKRVERQNRDYFTTSNDSAWVYSNREKNPHLKERGVQGAKQYAAWRKDNPNAAIAGDVLSGVPLAVASAPFMAGAGEVAYPILTNPYVDAGITSAFAAHGLNHAINEGINGWDDAAMTALELAPLGRLAKPLYKVGKTLTEPTVNWAKQGISKAPSSESSKYPDIIWDAKQMFRDGNNFSYTEEDLNTLNSYIPEYKEIERISKANGTYLKMPDGNTWKGDPREWVIAQSKNVRKAYGDEILTHGNSDSWFNANKEDVTGDILGKKAIWTNTNPYVGGTYGNKRYRFVIPKDANIKTVADAEGRFWGEVQPGMSTDMLVYPNLEENNVIRINNVVDRGTNSFFSKEWPKPLPKEEVPDYYKRVFPGDDLVLGEKVRRKALLGNNGNFDINNPNIFKGLIPIGIEGISYNNN